MKPSGIEPATFQFVAQLLNHCARLLNCFSVKTLSFRSVAMLCVCTIQRNIESILCYRCTFEFCLLNIVLLAPKRRKLLVWTKNDACVTLILRNVQGWWLSEQVVTSVQWLAKEASLKQSSRTWGMFNICQLHTVWIINLYTATSFSPRITPAALLVIEAIRNIDKFQCRTTIIFKCIYRRIFAYISCKSALKV